MRSGYSLGEIATSDFGYFFGSGGGGGGREVVSIIYGGIYALALPILRLRHPLFIDHRYTSIWTRPSLHHCLSFNNPKNANRLTKL